MPDRRNFVIALLLLLVLLIGVVAWFAWRPVSFVGSPERALSGDGSPGAFTWVSSDHSYAGDAEVEPPVVASVPLPSDVTFATASSSVVDPGAVGALMAPTVAAGLADGRLAVRIDAHASADGSDGDNLALSLRRGETIRDLLVGAGLSADRIQVIAHGEADLPNPAQPDSADNRVVVVGLIPARVAG